MTILGGTPPSKTPTPMMRDGVAIDAELYGADAPKPKEMHPPEVALRDVFRERVEDVATVMGLPEDKRQARHREFVGVLRDTGLEPAITGKLLYDAYTDAQLAAARGAPIDEAQRRNNEEEIRRSFRTAYKGDAEQLLDRTRAFIKAHPKLQAVVGTGAVESDPKVITAIAEHVRRTFWKPK